MYGCIDLANIDEASNVEVSDIMTYDEMVAYYAESKGISLKAAQVALGAPQGDISTCDIAYRTYSETSPTVTASTMPKTTMAAIQMTIIAPPFGFPLGFWLDYIISGGGMPLLFPSC